MLYSSGTSNGFCNRRRNKMNRVLSTENVSSASLERGFWKYISFRDIQNNLSWHERVMGREERQKGEGRERGRHKIRMFVTMICLTTLWIETLFLTSIYIRNTFWSSVYNALSIWKLRQSWMDVTGTDYDLTLTETAVTVGAWKIGESSEQIT